MCEAMDAVPIRVLLVEDESAYAELLEAVLSRGPASHFELQHAPRFADALRRLGERTFDVVLLDLTLPDQQGLETYARVKAVAPAVPVIVLTGLDDEKLALQAVRAGAQDYQVKGAIEGRMLARVIRYAIERKRAAEALRQSEEFFRLISESVTDLIAVIDQDGRRLFNSPSYRSLLGDPAQLKGTDAFGEVHPEDRPRVRQVFQETMATGQGQRAEYRMLLRDGNVRHIESQGSVIRDETGRPCKAVVVSRDITEHKQSVAVLRSALSDVKQSHEELKATQLQLVQAERREAVSTFAAGVAHEVKNPLQAIILGVDYLSHHVAAGDQNAAMVLGDMDAAVHRADGIIRGLLEFSACGPRDVKDEDLNVIIEHSLAAVEQELANYPIQLRRELAADLPLLKLDARSVKHVFINLLMNAIRARTAGGRIVVRTAAEELTAEHPQLRKSGHFKPGDVVVTVEVEDTPAANAEDLPMAKPVRPASALGLTVLKKIIELYGGTIETANAKDGGNQLNIFFKTNKRTSP